MTTNKSGELAYRRGSVQKIVSNYFLDDHPSLRSTWELSPFLAIGMNDPCSTLDLAPNGGYLAIRITPDAGVLLPHRFTLTCAMRPSAVYFLLPLSIDHSILTLVSVLSIGAPTFLNTTSCVATIRPTHHHLVCPVNPKSTT